MGSPGGHRQQFLQRQPDQEGKPQRKEEIKKKWQTRGGTKLAWIQTIPWLEFYLLLCGSL